MTACTKWNFLRKRKPTQYPFVESVLRDSGRKRTSEKVDIKVCFVRAVPLIDLSLLFCGYHFD